MERKYYSGGEGKPPIWIQPIIEEGKMQYENYSIRNEIYKR